ncbi:MAG: response regulator transcription factor [Chloroflexi bacterium]|nr:response regulator transcription factor [Chloroflexota bacterium]
MPLSAEGEFALVKQYLEAALMQSVRPGGSHSGDLDLYALLVDATAQQRDEAALRKYAPLAEETATRIDHKLYTAIAHRAWGVAHCLAGEYADAEARLNLALEIFQELDARWQIGRTLFELGALARAQGNAAAARDYFSRALSAFEDMHAMPDAARTRKALEQVVASPTIALPHDPNALTPREIEVLRLAQAGLSDAKIAEKLVISRRTVNTHLSSIYSKLGVNSRSAATRYALDHKLI